MTIGSAPAPAARQPLLSVIVPAFNSGSLIHATLASAAALDGVEPQIVVVDDGSRDGTADAAATHAGVEVIRQANAGDAAARQAGLRRAIGEFVIFLDHDDLLHPSAAVHHLEAINSAGALDMVFGANDVIDPAGNVIADNPQPPRRFGLRDCVLGTTPSFSQCLYRRSALERIGGFRAAAGSSADIDLNIRLLGGRAAGLCHGHRVMSYRQHPAQQTGSPARMFAQHLRVLEELLGPGGPLADAELLALGRRHWTRYYGKYLPAEILRQARRGDAGRALAATRVFLTNLPDTAADLVPHVAARLLRR